MMSCQGPPMMPGPHCPQHPLQDLPDDEQTWVQDKSDPCFDFMQRLQGDTIDKHCHPTELPAWDLTSLWEHMPAPTPKSQSPWVPGMLGFAAGAAVVTAVVTIKQ